MSFDYAFLLYQFPRLPFELIIEICNNLLGKDVLKCFTYLKDSKLRRALIDRFFQGRLDFRLSPHGFPRGRFPSGIYWWLKHSKIWNFILLVEVEYFLDLNQDINPPKLKLIDESSTSLISNHFFKRYVNRFSSEVDQLMLEMDVVNEDLDFLVDNLENVYGVVFGNFERCIDQLQDGSLLKWKNLSLFRARESELNDWSRLKFPSSLKTFQLSRCKNIDLSTLVIPSSVENIVIYGLGVFKFTYDEFYCRNPVEFPFEIFPSGLKTLVIDRIQPDNFEFIISVKKLPRNLVSLELYNTNILDFGSGDAKLDSSDSWPPSLEIIKLVNCMFEGSNLKQFYSTVWPENLRLLDLSENEFSSLSFLTCLPHSLDELHLTKCNLLEFDSVHGPIERIKFPKYLKKLFMGECKLKNLKAIEFPVYLSVLCLRKNYIEDLCEYEGENVSWADLVNLKTLNLLFNNISSLLYWYPPPNVKYLELSHNHFNEISSDCPIFNGSQNMKYSGLRTLDLVGFFILYIDPQVSVPPNLVRLDLRFNKGLALVPIPLNFFTHSLRELYWGDTKFRHLGVQDPYFNEVYRPNSTYLGGPHFDD